MTKFAKGARSSVKRWIILLIGVFIIISGLAVGAFMIARPYLDKVVAQQMAKHGVKSDKAQSQINGRIHLVNVRLPAPEGVNLTVGELSIRPPLSLLPGAATFTDILLEKGPVRVVIPKLIVKGIVDHGKDRATTSHALAALNRASVSSADAERIDITIVNSQGQSETTNIKGFSLSGYDSGRIGSISIDGLTTTLSKWGGAKSTVKLAARTGHVELHDLDLAYAYNIFTGRTAKRDSRGSLIFGVLNLNAIDINLTDGIDQPIHIVLEHLDSQGVAMKPLSLVPSDYLAAMSKAAKGEQKDDNLNRQEMLSTVLSAITKIDARIRSASFDNGKIGLSLRSLEFQPKQWTQALPEELIFNINGLVVNTSQLTADKAQLLAQMGYKTIEFDGKLEFNYQSRAHVLTVDSFSFNAHGLAAGALSAQAINVDSGLFSGSRDDAFAALTHVGLRTLKVRYCDQGFIRGALQWLAKDIDVSQEELNDLFYTIMTESPPLLINDAATAKTVSDALGKFAKDPGSLSVELVANQSQGLTQDDFLEAMQNNLGALLSKVQLSIDASSEKCRQ